MIMMNIDTCILKLSMILRRIAGFGLRYSMANVKFALWMKS